MGEALRKLKVPVGQVRMSQFYRAVETGRLLGFGEVVASSDYTEGGLVVSPNENNRRTQVMRAAAASEPSAGTNTVIVSHKPNIIDAFGKEWVDVREGEASIFKSDGKGGFALVACVVITDWKKHGEATQ